MLVAVMARSCQRSKVARVGARIDARVVVLARHDLPASEHLS